MQATTHHQGIERPFYGRREIDQQFTVDHTFFVTFYIEQLHIISLQLQVSRHSRQVVEVDRTVYHERVLTGSMDMVFVEHDFVVFHHDLFVVYPEAGSYSGHKHRGRIHLDISVHFRGFTTTLYRHLSFQHTI